MVDSETHNLDGVRSIRTPATRDYTKCNIQNVKFMAYLSFPMNFAEENSEQKEDLGFKPTTVKGIIVINTRMICAYNEMDSGNTLVRMSNGDAHDLPIKITKFEKLLAQTETILDLVKYLAEN